MLPFLQHSRSLQGQHTVYKTQTATRWRAPEHSHSVQDDPSHTRLADRQVLTHQPLLWYIISLVSSVRTLSICILSGVETVCSFQDDYLQCVLTCLLEEGGCVRADIHGCPLWSAGKSGYSRSFTALAPSHPIQQQGTGSRASAHKHPPIRCAKEPLDSLGDAATAQQSDKLL